MKLKHLFAIIICFFLSGLNLIAQSDEEKVVVFTDGTFKKGRTEFVKDSTQLKLTIISGEIFYYPLEEISNVLTKEAFIEKRRTERGEAEKDKKRQKRENFFVLVESSIGYNIGKDKFETLNNTPVRGNDLFGFRGKFSAAYKYNNIMAIGGGVGFEYYQFFDVDNDYIPYVLFPIFLNSQIYFGKGHNQFYLSNLIGVVNKFATSGAGDKAAQEGEQFTFYESGIGLSKRFKKQRPNGFERFNIGINYNITRFTPIYNDNKFEHLQMWYHLIGLNVGFGF